MRLRLIKSKHRSDHTASSRRTFEQVRLQNVLAVVPGLAILALEGSIERTVLKEALEFDKLVHFSDMRRVKHKAKESFGMIISDLSQYDN